MSAKDRVLAASIPVLERAIDEFWDGDFAKLCESEIERMIACTFFFCNGTGPIVTFPSREAALKGGFGFFLEPQFVIGQYRVDFLLGAVGHGEEGDEWLLKCIAIECDGHDFHERTKEQAERDKSRDRFLSQHVGRVLRFTGREIYRDPGQCLVEALNTLGVVKGLR